MENNIYEDLLKKQYDERELSKQNAFKALTLNTKLSKFQGYQSELDVYSFQREFEKLRLRSYPKKLLGDLLKNNYLAEPAIYLVKSVDDIDVIWERLHKAYGDPATSDIIY